MSKDVTGFGTTAILLMIGVYLIPTIIATVRRCHKSWAIVAFNLLLGWTAFGWGLALAWACTNRINRRTMVQMADGTTQAHQITAPGWYWSMAKSVRLALVAALTLSVICGVMYGK
jgi:hypothetical protein